NSASYIPQISADGRFVAFQSFASNLVPVDTNGNLDVFVRDLHKGTTTLVSVNRDGSDSGNGASFGPQISSDGRFVVFESTATNLLPQDINVRGAILVRDLVKGTTTLVSVNAAGTDNANNGASNPVLSENSRYIAFTSASSDLLPNDTCHFNGRLDAYVRDLRKSTTVLVSVNQDGTGCGNGSSFVDAISRDGRYI